MEARFAAKSGMGTEAAAGALVKNPNGLPRLVMAMVWPWGKASVTLLKLFWNSRALTCFMSNILSDMAPKVKPAATGAIGVSPQACASVIVSERSGSIRWPSRCRGGSRWCGHFKGEVNGKDRTFAIVTRHG